MRETKSSEIKGKADLGISRNSHDRVSIRIRDDASGLNIVELELSLEEFALAVTGMFVPNVSATMTRDPHLGQECISERRTVLYPDGGYDKDKAEKFLIENCQEEGWILDTYLGAQNSRIYRDGKTYLNYGVYRYEEKS